MLVFDLLQLPEIYSALAKFYLHFNELLIHLLIYSSDLMEILNVLTSFILLFYVCQRHQLLVSQ